MFGVLDKHHPTPVQNELQCHNITVLILPSHEETPVLIWFLSLVCSASLAHESTPQEFEMEEEIPFFSGEGYDSDWLPPDEMISIRLETNTTGMADVLMEGESNLSWPQPLELSFTPSEQSGQIDANIDIDVIISVQFDISVYQWSGAIYTETVSLNGSESFDPFALEGDNEDPIEVFLTSDGQSLISYTQDIFAGVSLNFSGNLEPTASVSFQGLSFETDEDSISSLNHSIAIDAGSDPVETEPVFTGQVDAILDMEFVPVLSICAPIVGCYDWTPTEFVIDTLTSETEHSFEPMELSFPMPILDVDDGDIDFGTISTDATENWELVIDNDGSLPLSGTVEISGDTGSFDIFPETFLATEDTSSGIVISYEPQSAGAHEAVITLISNDPLYPEVSISVTGSAEEPGDPDNNDDDDDENNDDNDNDSDNNDDDNSDSDNNDSDNDDNDDSNADPEEATEDDVAGSESGAKESGCSSLQSRGPLGWMTLPLLGLLVTRSRRRSS